MDLLSSTVFNLLDYGTYGIYTFDDSEEWFVHFWIKSEKFRNKYIQKWIKRLSVERPPGFDFQPEIHQFNKFPIPGIARIIYRSWNRAFMDKKFESYKRGELIYDDYSTDLIVCMYVDEDPTPTITRMSKYPKMSELAIDISSWHL